MTESDADDDDDDARRVSNDRRRPTSKNQRHVDFCFQSNKTKILLQKKLKKVFAVLLSKKVSEPEFFFSSARSLKRTSAK